MEIRTNVACGQTNLSGIEMEDNAAYTTISSQSGPSTIETDDNVAYGTSIHRGTSNIATTENAAYTTNTSAQAGARNSEIDDISPYYAIITANI